MPSTNFEEPGNWDSGKIPCSRDRVVFPKNAPPVFIQVNATLTELVSKYFEHKFADIICVSHLW